jgi:asparagine synthase (glutamine-hydrolysing)
VDFLAGYRRFLSLTPDPAALLINGDEHHPAPFADEGGRPDLPLLARMQRADVMTYLPDDILAKVDRASMSAGLEVRVPLLDHRIWEWSAGLPEHLKLKSGQGKIVLKRILERHLPPALFARPKTGFAVPLAAWLRTELRGFAETGLDPKRLEADGVFAPAAVRRLWREHLAARHDHAPVLWAILMFGEWKRAVLDAR